MSRLDECRERSRGEAGRTEEDDSHAPMIIRPGSSLVTSAEQDNSLE
jgi:hypothetical protein